MTPQEAENMAGLFREEPKDVSRWEFHIYVFNMQGRNKKGGKEMVYDAGKIWRFALHLCFCSDSII